MPAIVMMLYVLAGGGAVVALLILVLSIIIGKKRVAETDDEEDFSIDPTAGIAVAADGSAQSVSPAPAADASAWQTQPAAMPEWQPAPQQTPVMTDFQMDMAPTQRREEPAIAPFSPVQPVVAPTAAQSAAPFAQTDPEPPTEALQVPQLGNVSTLPSAKIGGLTIRIDCAQSIGMRQRQEDAFCISPVEDAEFVRTKGVCAVLCDGMGGLAAGAQAAAVGSSEALNAYVRSTQLTGEALIEAAENANSVVCQLTGKDGQQCGSTLIAAAVTTTGLSFVSVGDSHLYVLRGGKLYQLNQDHNYMADLIQQVQRGEITLEQARSNPERAHLTSYLGMQFLAKIDVSKSPVALAPGDRVMLCSDGLFKTLSREEMASVIGNERPGHAAEALVSCAMSKARRHQDNITIILLYADTAEIAV